MQQASISLASTSDDQNMASVDGLFPWASGMLRNPMQGAWTNHAAQNLTTQATAGLEFDKSWVNLFAATQFAVLLSGDIVLPLGDHLLLVSREKY